MLTKKNMVCIYCARPSVRLAWNENQLKPYIVHQFQDNHVDWMFDTFLLFDYIVEVNEEEYELTNDFYNGDRSVNAHKTHWEQLIDYYFGTQGVQSGLVFRINKVINDTIALQQLSEPDFQHGIVLGLPEPLAAHGIGNGLVEHITDFSDPNYEIWGELDDAYGNPESIGFIRMLRPTGGIDPTHEHPNCSRAVNWFIDQCIARWEEYVNYLSSNSLSNHLELSGFHWPGESTLGRTVAFETIERVKNHLNSINAQNTLHLRLSFAPTHSFYMGVLTDNAPYTPYLDQCPHFDTVCPQGNYSLGAGYDQREFSDLQNIIARSASRGNGLTFEHDYVSLFSKDLSRYNRVLEYIYSLHNHYLMPLLYYLGDRLLAAAYDASMPYDSNFVFVNEDYSLFDKMASFIIRRRSQIKRYNNADINEDGAVDVVDLNIANSEMIGNTTPYSGRADVNRDGNIDILDVNEVLNVMTNQIANMPDDYMP